MTNDNLKVARDEVELVNLMQERVPYEKQDREEMRERLELAKAHIDIALNKMDTVEELKQGGCSDE